MKYYFEGIPILKYGEIWDKYTDKERLQYALGGLLYTPASNEKIVQTLLEQKYPHLKAWAFCLEDSIQENGLLEAEKRLVDSLRQLNDAVLMKRLAISDMPLLFIRVRSAAHLARFYPQIASYDHLLTGFIAPKFEPQNMKDYGEWLKALNHNREFPLYLMPILESESIIDLRQRLDNLSILKDYLDTIQPWILNIRVGGNDFANRFALRRNIHQNIYEMGLLNSVLMDILNIFGSDYVVSAPVWEYFGTAEEMAWQKGLQEELKLDRLNGFIGKTAIHPAQLSLINRALLVSEEDYQDALQIVQWSPDETLGVIKGVGSKRMNETRVHKRWAKKILALADIYGVITNNDEQ